MEQRSKTDAVRVNCGIVGMDGMDGMDVMD
jgi:hypothetical protein